MDKLAQVIGLLGARSGSVWVLVLLLSPLTSCGPEPVSAPAPPVSESRAEPDVPSPPPDFWEIAGHPLADWTYGESLEELHAVWRDRFALGANLNPDPDTLWPYADAVELDGASWGMTPKTTKLIFFKIDGHAYQRSSPAHPKAGDRVVEKQLTPETLAASGWTAAQTSPGLQRFNEGTGFSVAGPIRATESCLACHAYTRDQVVALLVYEFEEIPDD